MTSLSTIILTASIHAIRKRLRHQSDQAQQDQFLWWGLDETSSEHQTFVQITGLQQLAHLSAVLLKGIVPENQYPIIAKYAGAINAYFFYEIISDNLAHGFGPLADHDATWNLRRGLLHTFNEAMVARLRGDGAESARLMARIKSLAASVSSLDHNLNAEKRSALLKAYAAATGTSAEATEFDLWLVLHQNIEACARILDLLKESPLRETLRGGLIRRYQSLNELMANTTTSRDALLDQSTWTILIVPTLLYFIAAIHEASQTRQPLKSAQKDGLISEATYTAATLVRLLNDLGSLVTIPETEFRSHMEFLKVCYEAEPTAYPDIKHLILATAPYLACLTRLHKDLKHGEHNVGLHRLAAQASIPDLLHQFEGNLHHYRRVYQQQSAHLAALLTRLTEALGDDRTAQLVQRIVTFHIQMYTARFEDKAGEYAI